MHSQGAGRGMEPAAHKCPARVSTLSGAQAVLLPARLWVRISRQSRNDLLPKTVKTQLKNAARGDYGKVYLPEEAATYGQVSAPEVLLLKTAKVIHPK